MEIFSNEVLDDIRSAAWLESELHPELDRHRRHEMADICEDGNIERVWRVLALAEAEIRLALHRILYEKRAVRADNSLERTESWQFRFLTKVAPSLLSFIREKIHEYMVARVMADRMGVLISDSATIWEERVKDALAALNQAAAGAQLSSGSVRRPLWPM